LDGKESIYDPPDMPNFWDFSDEELALACQVVAQSRLAGAHAEFCAEALRLLSLWREALETPDRTGEERERRHCLSSGLRKRTIQILVRLSLEGVLPTLEY
jgi:hypothetical protein